MAKHAPITGAPLRASNILPFPPTRKADWHPAEVRFLGGYDLRHMNAWAFPPITKASAAPRPFDPFVEPLIPVADLAIALNASAHLPRSVFELVLESMIDRLDAIDGDADMEDSDPCCANVDDRGRSLLANPADFPTDDDEPCEDYEPDDGI